jgi:SdrD B-like domain
MTKKSLHKFSKKTTLNTNQTKGYMFTDLFTKSAQNFKKLVTIIFAFSLVFGSGTLLVRAAVPAVETTLRVIADGSSPFDATTFDVTTATNGGNDASNTNGVVRVLDYMTYRVEVSLNNKNDTNTVARVYLDTNQEWNAVPASCLTTNVTPISSISDLDTVAPGDDKRLLICNFGNASEGTKFAVNATAQVTKNATNAVLADQTNCASVVKPALPQLNPTYPTLDNTSGCISAYVTASSDNSTVVHATPTNTLVTTTFRVDLEKRLPGDPLTPNLYSPLGNVPGNPVTTVLGHVIEYNITGRAASGSEVVKNTAGKANFTLRDCYLDNNSVNGSNSSNANCDVGGWVNSSGAKLYNWDTSLPIAAQDGCVASSTEVTDANLICTQTGGAGKEIQIQLNNVDVTYPVATGQLFKFKVRVWIPIIADINSDAALCSSPGNCNITTINQINFKKFNFNPSNPLSEVVGEPISVTNLLNYNGVGEPQTNNSISYPLASTSGVNYGELLKKFFSPVALPGDIYAYGYSNVSLNSTIPVTLSVRSNLNTGENVKRIHCDKIDTTNFEFDSVAPPGNFRGGAVTNATTARIDLFNPSLYTNLSASFPAGTIKDNALFTPLVIYNEANLVAPQIKYEYGVDTTYSTTPNSMRTDTCNDSDATWVTNPNLAPGGKAAINKVRVVLDGLDMQKINRDYYGSSLPTSSVIHFTYLVKVKGTNPYPTTIATKNYNFLPNYSISTFTNKTSGVVTSSTPALVTETLGAETFSYSATYYNADRVNLVGATYNISKKVLNKFVYDAGEEVEYEVTPSLEGLLSGSVDFSFLDTMPASLKMIPGSFVESTVGTANGTYVFPTTQSGNTFTVLLNGAQTGLPLRKFKFKVKILPSATANTYLNNITMTALNPSSTPQITQLIQDSQLCNVGTSNGLSAQCTTFLPPQSNATIQILNQNQYNIYKEVPKTVYEVNTAIPFTLNYVRGGSELYSPGDFIDILPYNGDVTDGNYGNFTVDRENTLGTTPGSASNYTEGTSDGYPGLASVPIGTNSETFTYTKANPTTIPSDVCHSDNQPLGFIPSLTNGSTGSVHPCYYSYIFNGNKYSNGVTTGSGLIVWCTSLQFASVGCPLNLGEVKAFRIATVAHTSSQTLKRINFSINPKRNKENDIYCNSYSGRVPEISLNIISNDVCAKVVSGNISGTIWRDNIVNNGTKQLTDTNLSGLVVELLSSSGTPFLNPATGIAMTATTDSNGFYEFKDLSSGSYQTRVQTPPSGLIQTYDLDNGILAPAYTTANNSGTFILSPISVPNPDPVDATANPTVLSNISDQLLVDYGYGSNLSIGNRVWFDSNNNGSFDAGEQGVNGVDVDLYSASADTDNDGLLSTTEIAATIPFATLTTANDTRVGSTNGLPGYYQFDNLPANKYFVAIPASNFNGTGVLSGTLSSPTPSGVGDTQDDLKDHGDFPVGGTSVIAHGVVSKVIDLTPGAEPTTVTTKTDDDTNANTDTTIDFGFWQKFSLGNRVWYDVNNNGTIDVGETGVPNVAVNLINPATNAVITTVNTDANGYYRFDNLDAGDYVVEVSSTAFDTVGDPLHRYIPSTNGTELSPNSDVDNNDNAITGSVASGFRTGTVTLGPLGTEPTAESDLGPGGQGAADKFANMTVDLGFIPPAHIGDTVYFDQNNNGTQDPGEVGIPNATVTLTEAGPNGINGDGDDVTIGTQTTNSTGKYDFWSLVPGKYKTMFNIASTPGGVLTTPGSKTVTLAIGQDDLTHDYGISNIAGQFGDLVWYDYNKNGVKDTNEPGIGNVQVELFQDINGDGLLDTGDLTLGTKTTNASGTYNFINLLSDDNIPANGAGSAKYIARIVNSTLPTGVTTTILGTVNTNNNNQNSAAYPFTLTPAAQSNLTGDFGYIGNATFGDYIWFDVDGDGVQDAGEPPVPGIPVTLTWAGTDGIFGNADDMVLPTTQTTNATGNYSFTGLLPGNYRATPNLTAYPTLSLTTPATIDQALVVGQNFVAGDFGIKGNGTIGNQVFADPNQNGVFDSGEPTIAYVKIKLIYDVNNNGIMDPGEFTVATATTDSNGVYQFQNLPTDDLNATNGVGFPYAVMVDTTTLPAGSFPTIPGTVATNNNNQNQAGTAAMLTSAITSIQYMDFGYVGTPAIGIVKTIFKGHNSGVGCATATNEVIVVNKNQTAENVTYCFTVTNTGQTYLDTITLADPTLTITQAAMTLLSGVSPLAPGASQVWYYQTAVSTSSTNTASTSARPVSPTGTPTGQPNVTANDPAGARLIYVFDPPFGIKTGTYQGNDIVRWTMVWINDSGATANNVEIVDEPPVGTTYSGNLVCTPRGLSTVISCTYEAPSASYPRGRVLVRGNIAPNPGVTQDALATNAMQIAFDNLVPASIGTVTNQGVLNWDPTPSIPNSAFRIATRSPAGVVEGTTLNLSLVRTGINNQMNTAYAVIILGTAAGLLVLRRRMSPSHQTTSKWLK